MSDMDAAVAGRLQALDHELTWQQAALIIGEQCASVGPTDYYKFTPNQWFNWMRAALQEAPHAHPETPTE